MSDYVLMTRIHSYDKLPYHAILANSLFSLVLLFVYDCWSLGMK